MAKRMDRQKVLDLLRKQVPVPDIAASCNCSQPYVYKVMREEGIPTYGRYSEEEREGVLREYYEYEGNITDFAKSKGLSPTVIYYWLERKGLPTRSVSKKGRFTTEDERRIVALYRQCKTLRDIADQYEGSCPTSIRKVLLRNGVDLRKADEVIRLKKTPPLTYQLDHHAFDNAEERELASYFIGLLLTDGSVIIRKKRPDSPGSYCIALSTAEDSADILEEYRRFLGTDAPVAVSPARREGHQPHHKVCVHSKHMAEVLATYGVVPNKTSTKYADDRLKDNRHFWRGVLDGDGCVRTNFVVLGGTSKDLIVAWADYARRITGDRSKVTTRELPSGKIEYKFGIFGPKSKTLYQEVYTSHSVSMKRKQAVVDAALGGNTNRQS